MENVYTIKESLSDPQILKLIPNEHLVWIQHGMSQSYPERISQTQIFQIW